MTQASLTEKQLEKLSKDPKNVVYKWGERDRLPNEEVVCLDEVASKITRLYDAYCDFRQQFVQRRVPIRNHHYRRIQARLLQDEEWARFNHTHPLIFDRIVHPETTQKEIDALLFMVRLKQQNDTPEGYQQLGKHIMQQFAMTPEEWEQKKQQDGIVGTAKPMEVKRT